MVNSKRPIIVTIAASFGLLVLAISYFALHSARLSTIMFGNTTGLGPQLSTGTPYDDPLITVVPEADRSVNQKTKVFVSSQDPILGSADAKVYVILYGSLLDYDMYRYLVSMADVQADYGNDVAIIWKDFTTLDIDDEAAVVGHCANTVEKFWDYALAVGTASVDNSFASIAEQAGVNRVELEDCLATGGMEAVVSQNVALGQALGVTTTHSLFVNDDLFVDPMSIDELKLHIDAALASFN